MKAVLRIRRLNPEVSPEPYDQDFEVDYGTGDVVLSCLHYIHDRRDGTLAFRYSCRGAICGSCAVRINGRAALACKTQMSTLDTSVPVVVEPLLNSSVIKDLVVDQAPFFEALRATMPWLNSDTADAKARTEALDPVEGLSKQVLDQWNRSTDCIMCQSCFSDCPKRAEDPSFEGPAASLSRIRRICHPQEENSDGRLAEACAPGGIYSCDRHADCVKVCPKDCRPLRAITMLKGMAEDKGIAPQATESK